MPHLFYLDRKNRKVEEEKIYGGALIKLLYCPKPLCSWLSKPVLSFFAKTPLFSNFFSKIQKHSFSKRKITSFMEEYNVHSEDFIEPKGGYPSFHDFFIRRLKEGSRPLDEREKVMVMPADGRYLVFSNISSSEQFFIKGQKLSLQELVADEALAKRYEGGSMVFARLAPPDYHWFHFPCHCIPSQSVLINGSLYSVNPLALKKKISILWQNKRMRTELQTSHFGTVLYMEIGATCVGSIQQRFTPGKTCKKGEAKGYFEFGGSSVLMLFEKNKIFFDEDLVEASKQGLEVKANMGESLGRAGESFFEL